MSREPVGYESNLGAAPRAWPRGRRRVLLIAAVLTATVLLIAWQLFPVLIRDGAVWARIDVDVRDAATGRPVSGAAVAVLDAAGATLPPHISLATPTDSAGRATARVLAGAGRADYRVADRTDFSTNGESVQVAAPGYAIATVALPRGGSTWRVLGGRIRAVLRAGGLEAPRRDAGHRRRARVQLVAVSARRQCTPS